jgi:endonuclease/exonuclease/phosphatase (EEP) superfamily protein YafD
VKLRVPHPACLAVAAAPWIWFVVRDISPALDVVALSLPVTAAVVVAASMLASLLLWRPLPLIVGASWSVFALVAVVGPWLPRGADDVANGVDMIAANVLVPQDESGDVAGALVAADADVLVLSESSKRLEATLAGSYPFGLRNQFDGSVGLFSRYELRELPLPERLTGLRLHRVEVLAPSGSFVLYAMHLDKPGILPADNEISFDGQSRVVGELIDAIDDEVLPVVVAGDLNIGDRTAGYRRLTGTLDDAARSDWSGPTSRKDANRPFLLRIDHILMPESWCSAGSGHVAIPWSDHVGVRATVGPCRDAEPGSSGSG